LRIGIDARALQESHRFRGIGAYLANLLRAFDEVGRQHRYVLYQWRGPSIAEELRLSAAFETVSMRQPSPKPIIRRLRNQYSRDIRVDRNKLDAFLQPDPAYGRPDGDVKTATVLHDLIPLIFREHYFPPLSRVAKLGLGLKQFVLRRIDWHSYRWQLRELCSADAIIAISESTKADFLRSFRNVSEGRVAVIPLGCDPGLRPAKSVKVVLRRFHIRSPFLLYVGGIDFRKNVGALLAAFRNLQLRSGDGPQLVLVGNDFDAREEILEARELFRQYQDLLSQGKIIRIGFVPTQELAALYTAAAALVFPSRYEGFGMTVLEAMSCGCPVIAFDNSSIHEVAGRAALLLQPHEDLSAAMEKILTDDTLRQRLRRNGLSRSRKFSWTKTARRTLTLLEKLSASSQHKLRNLNPSNP